MSRPDEAQISLMLSVLSSIVKVLPSSRSPLVVLRERREFGTFAAARFLIKDMRHSIHAAHLIDGEALLERDEASRRNQELPSGALFKAQLYFLLSSGYRPEET